MEDKPDNIAFFPCKHRKPLCWNYPHGNSISTTYVNESFERAVSAANVIDTNNLVKNCSLTASYHFEAVTIETVDLYCDGCRLSGTTENKRDTFALLRRLSLALQGGTAASNLCSETEPMSF